MQTNVLSIRPQAHARNPASRVVLGAALLVMVVGSAYATIPLPVGPVPMTLQSLAVLMAGVWGGPRLGAAVCATYLALGTAGVPVFAGGAAAPGLALLALPTAGYLLAFPVSPRPLRAPSRPRCSLGCSPPPWAWRRVMS